jgi:hypothetical protein
MMDDVEVHKVHNGTTVKLRKVLAGVPAQVAPPA